MKDDQMTNFDEGKQYSGYDPNYGYNLMARHSRIVCIHPDQMTRLIRALIP